MAVNLSKGQKISLDKGMTLALVGLGWDTNRYSGGAEFDLDASAFLLGANGKVRKDEDFIFYGNLKSADGSVTHTGDNRTGEGEGDDERIRIDLEAISPHVQKIVFVVTIHEAQSKRQTFGMVENSYVRILDEEHNEREVCRFNLKENGSTVTSVIFAELYKQSGEWQFKAIGEGKIADLNGILGLYM